MALSMFANNPSLVGFESPSRMLLTTIKELFENSLDACRSQPRSMIQHHIQVNVRPVSSENAMPSELQPLELVVRDNGGGMKRDPAELVQIFSSTKSGRNNIVESDACLQQQQATSGKFGVGLTSSILHSHIIFGNESFYELGGVCKVRSRYLEESSSSHVEVECVFGVDRVLESVVCLKRTQTSCDNLDNEPLTICSQTALGTEVRIIVPGGSLVSSATKRITAYFERFELTKHVLDCSITYVEDNCLSNSFIKISSPLKTVANLYRIKDSQINNNSLMSFLRNSQQLENLPPNNNYSISTRAIDDCRATVCVVLTDLPELDEPSSSISSSSSACSHHISMNVVRLANHVPLPDTQPSIACGLCLALTNSRFAEALQVLDYTPIIRYDFSATQHNLGIRLNGNPTLNTNTQELCLELIDLTLIADKRPSSSSSGRSISRPGFPTGLNGLRLTCVIDIQANDLCFGSLDKSYLANHSEYCEAVTNATLECLFDLKDQLPHFFTVQVSHKDSAFEALIQDEVPAFADALASLIAEADEDNIRECLHLLNLSSTGMRQSVLSAALTNQVTSAYESSRDMSSEWTKQGKLRKNPPKRPRDEEQSEIDPYFEFNVIELKDILRARGLKVSGTKTVLIERIKEDIELNKENNINSEN